MSKGDQSSRERKKESKKIKTDKKIYSSKHIRNFETIKEKKQKKN